MNVSNFYLFQSTQIAAGTAYRVLSDTTLAAPATSIDTGTFSLYNSDKLKINLIFGTPSGGVGANLTFNADGGNNYDWYNLTSAGAATSSAGATSIQTATGTVTEGSVNADISNTAAANKKITGMSYTAGGRSFWGVWANATDPITRITVSTGTAETYPIGTRLVVLGL